MPSSLPIILNGDAFSPADLPRSLASTGADALMIGRGALWNPSIFAVGYPTSSDILTTTTTTTTATTTATATTQPAGSHPQPAAAEEAATAEEEEAAAAAAAEAVAAGSSSGVGGGGAGGGGEMVPQATAVSRYVELCEANESPVGNVKYVAMLMLEGGGKTEPFKMFQRAKTQADLRAAAAACREHPHFCQPGGVFLPAALEPPPDLPDAPSLPVNAWRHVPAGWKPGQAPVRRCKAPTVRAAPVLDDQRAAAAAAATKQQEQQQQQEAEHQAPAAAAGERKRTLDQL